MIGIHQRFEGLVETALEAELDHDLFRDISHVEQDGHEVTLLAIIVIVIIIVLDKLISTWDVTTNVLEISRVQGICQDEVVGHALDGFFRSSNCIQSLRYLLRYDLETIVVMKIVIFLKKPVGILEF
jgi:hypothetical protein